MAHWTSTMSKSNSLSRFLTLFMEIKLIWLQLTGLLLDRQSRWGEEKSWDFSLLCSRKLQLRASIESLEGKSLTNGGKRVKEARKNWSESDMREFESIRCVRARIELNSKTLSASITVVWLSPERSRGDRELFSRYVIVCMERTALSRTWKLWLLCCSFFSACNKAECQLPSTLWSCVIHVARRNFIDNIELTFSPHSHLEALSQSTVLTLISMVLIDRTIAIPSTWVR